MRIQRRQDDPADFAGGEILDRLNLIIPIILPKRTFPNDFRFDALGIEFAFRFDGSGVNGFPEFMSRAFWDDSNGITAGGCQNPRCGRAEQSGREQNGREEFHKAQHMELDARFQSFRRQPDIGDTFCSVDGSD